MKNMRPRGGSPRNMLTPNAYKDGGNIYSESVLNQDCEQLIAKNAVAKFN